MAGLTVLKKGEGQEPLISSPSSANISKAQIFSKITPEEINDQFRRGYITARQRNDIMREKAHQVTQEMLQEKGYFATVLAQGIKHIQNGFDNIRDAVVREVPADKTEAFKADMVASAHAIWGQIQVLTGLFSAVGEVTGAQVERWSLAAGASPGLARILNISTDVGAGFIPVGKATQSAVQGIQRAQKMGARSVTNQAGAVGKGASEAGQTAEEARKAAEAAEKAMTEMEGVNKVAMEAVGEGLKAEGVSRRGFLQFLATVPAAASAVKGMLKSTAVSPAAEVAKAATRRMPTRLGVNKVFTFRGDEAAIVKMTDGSLVQVVESGREGSSYRVLSGKNTGLEFSTTDITDFNDAGDMVTKLNPEVFSRKEQAVLGRAVAKNEIANTAPFVPMTPEQELFHIASRDYVHPPGHTGAMQLVAEDRVKNASDDITRYKRMLQEYNENPKKFADQGWRPDSLQDLISKAEQDLIEEQSRYSSYLKGGSQHRDITPEGGPKEPLKPGEEAPTRDPEQLFKDPPPEIEEPGQLVMVNGRWHVRGNHPDELLPAMYGESTYREKFLADLTKFRREMSALSETQTHEQTAAMAERLGLGLDDLRNVVPGAALDEKQMLAYLHALEPQVQEAVRLAKATRGGNESDLTAFANHMSNFFTIAPTFRAAEVTAGRSVDILRETPPMKSLTDMLTGWDPEAMAAGNFQGAIRSMAEDVIGIADQPEKLLAMGVQSHTLWARFKTDAWPQMREAYINLMLARPLTHVRNMIGNSIAAANAVTERAVGGMFSADRSNGLVGQEGWYLLKGMGAGIADGLAAAKNVMVSPEAAAAASKLDYIPHQIPGAIGRAINIPGDMLRATDEFFRTILKRGSYYAEALRDGVHAGMSNVQSVVDSAAYRAKFGNESLSEFVARRVNFPTQSMKSSGEEFATHQTYQDQLGALATKIRDVGQVGPLVLWFPFMKTYINMTKYAWDRTPGLQLISSQLYKDIAAGGVKADEAIGRITMANLQGMWIYQMAQEGYLTGGGPVDPGLRRAWMATHQPYSVKTKKGWAPISNLEPESTIFGMMADFASIHNQLDGATAEQSGMAIAFAIMKNIGNQGWNRTLSDLVDLSGDIREGHSVGPHLRDVALAPFMTVVGGGPVGGAVTRAEDPIQRETRTFLDSVKSRVPGYSKDVPPVRDVYGEPVMPPQAVGGAYLNMVSPVYEKTIPDDRVRKEGDSLEVKVPAFPWTLGGTSRDDFDLRAPFPEDMLGVELSPKQRDRAQELFKDNLRHPEFGMEKMWLDTPEYQNSTRAGKREMFMDAMAMYRRKAIDTLTVEDPDIGKKLIESQALKLMPLLQPQEQDTLRQETTRSMDLFYRMAPEMKENLLRWGQPPGEGE